MADNGTGCHKPDRRGPASLYRSVIPQGVKEKIMVKTATFEALLEDTVPDGKGGFLFTLEGKTYTLREKDEVRGIAESHGYIIIY
jgi:hypothetical protein